MGLVRRGGLGILMFAAALALMPVLVLWYQHHPEPPAGDGTLIAAGSGPAGGATAPTPTGSDASARPVIPRSPGRPSAVPSRAAVGGTGAGSTAGPTLVGFAGIISGSVVSGPVQGAVVSGVVQIELVVSGSPGTILFNLAGPVSTSYTATGPPFLFTPQDAPWNTTRFANGQYVLTATATQRSVPPVSVTFQLANPAPQRSAPG